MDSPYKPEYGRDNDKILSSKCAGALARAGCDVGLKDSAGMTGREVAEGEGHVAVVARLQDVEHVGMVPVRGDATVVELILAAAGGDGAAVARLLAAGADPNVSVTTQTPGPGRAHPGRLSALSVSQSKSGLYGAFVWARRALNRQKRRFPARADGEALQTSALIGAVVNGRLETARLLLVAGADPSRADSRGVTPLMQAAGDGQLEVLRLLLGRGAARSRSHCRFVLQRIHFVPYSLTYSVPLFLKRQCDRTLGALVDAVRMGSGSTAFHHACGNNQCGNNQADCAEALIRAGCDVGLKTKDGQTGRELAEVKGHAAVVARLRAVVAEQLRAAQAAGPALEPAPADADADADAAAAPALLIAATEGDVAEVARLLTAGAGLGRIVALCHRSSTLYQIF
jgi:hypothetical protein